MQEILKLKTKQHALKIAMGFMSLEVLIFILIATVIVSLAGAVASEQDSLDNESYIEALTLRQAQIKNETNVVVDLPIHFAIDKVNRKTDFDDDPQVYIDTADVTCFIDDGKQIDTENIGNAFDCLGYDDNESEEFMFYYELYNESKHTEIVGSSGFSYPIYDPYVITAGFNSSDDVHQGSHDGVDFVPLSDTSVLSSSSGTITKINTTCEPFGGYIGSTCGYGFGNYVIEETEVEGVKYRIWYGHMSEITAKVGDTVEQGEVLGKMGNSGNTTGAHVHLQIEIKLGEAYIPIDPMPLLTAPSIDGDKEEIMSEAGIEEVDYDYVDFIVSHESSWDYKAQNPTSSAYGLCQALPGEKMAVAGSDWRTNPVTQMKWCDGYANDRYGSWQSAYSFWVSNEWW
ncbi:peptidoglycan DD-metalloendopeptidase family protein [Mollicutes bacterium LVI A0078]|nr:peptidoglycan DD-metalloendopeptidase family protein [Mollicutes bacterium LVI A0075]WOO90567.1 peptidoglycan DD-metalloendopeptidase family protein [Mollicutes bacterium LVI A0078]